MAVVSGEAYASLLKQAAGVAGSAEDLKSFRAWLSGGKVDQKREDALELLHRLRQAAIETPSARFRFERTTMWEHLLTAATDDPLETMVLTELRLEGPQYLEERQTALDLFLGAPDKGGGSTAEIGENAAITATRIREHARDETRRARAGLLIEPLTDTIILRRLRDTGDYERLASRARAKKDRLASLDLFPPEIGDVDASPEDLTAWFTARFHQDAEAGPMEADPTEWASRLDFEDTLTFLRALAGEYLYIGME
jgi:hypothetical protein